MVQDVPFSAVTHQGGAAWVPLQDTCDSASAYKNIPAIQHPQLCSGCNRLSCPITDDPLPAHALCHSNHQLAPPVGRATGFNPVPSRHHNRKPHKPVTAIKGASGWKVSLGSHKLLRSVLPPPLGGEWRCRECNCKSHNWEPERTLSSYYIVTLSSSWMVPPSLIAPACSCRKK